jgi:hypothetical protein
VPSVRKGRDMAGERGSGIRLPTGKEQPQVLRLPLVAQDDGFS